MLFTREQLFRLRCHEVNGIALQLVVLLGRETNKGRFGLLIEPQVYVGLISFIQFSYVVFWSTIV